MSTFSGLSTALSSLVAQRQALEVAANNTANATTVGYTRQRANLAGVPAASVASMFSTGSGVGQGTRVVGVQRLADAYLDARVHTASGAAGYLSVRAAALADLEKTVGEPGDTGLSAQLSAMWAAWEDLGNAPDKASAGAVVLQSARVVADRIGSLYTAAQTQWTQTRAQAATLVDQVNTAAAGVADLNSRIAAVTLAGGSAHELSDQRDLLVAELAGLVGATARTRPDGQVDVVVGGNALVDGSRASALAVSGARTFADATGDATAVPPVAGQAVTVVWADRPTLATGITGGTVAGTLAVLAPADGNGTGGPLVEAAAQYDALARTLADQVNALHAGGVTSSGAPGGDFFAFAAGRPPALGLTVAVTTPAGIATAAPGNGALDGSVADAIGNLAHAADGPGAQWNRVVVSLGVDTRSAATRSTVAGAALQQAQGQQLAQAGVDTDEEAVSMLAHQRAYEGAARVLTVIDEMLDVLINRTGVVGR